MASNVIDRTQKEYFNLKSYSTTFIHEDVSVNPLGQDLFKLVKIKDDFIWHQHDDTDEVFIVLEGKIFIEFEDETMEINEGEMIVVPKGVKHKPFAEEEAKIMLIEPMGTVNTGEIEDKLTAPNDQWI